MDGVFVFMVNPKGLFSAILAVILILSVALFLSGCVDTQPVDGEDIVSYSVPVEITNAGEASALNFDLYLFVDGEKSVIKKISQLKGGESIIETLPIVVESGTHTIRVVVNDNNRVKEFRRENNEDAITFDF